MQNGSAERFTTPEGGEEVACEAYHSGRELNQVLISFEGEGRLRGLAIGIDESREIVIPSVYILCLHNKMLHNRIAVLRSERKLSRAELATAVGVNVQTIGFLERGDHSPSLDLALRIAEVFKLPVEAVFSREPFRLLSEQVYEMQRREA
ncbi:MAG TPA: helix-turn-helix transcriptional regulator [Terriglobus sp.]